MTGKVDTAADRVEAVRVALSGIANRRDIAELTWASPRFTVCERIAAQHGVRLAVK
jgi:hypothetical protein